MRDPHLMGSSLHSLLGDGTQSQAGAHYFFDGAEVDSFHALLAKPYQHFIEMSEYVYLSRVLEYIRNEVPHLSLSMTTRTAFKQPVAEFFTAHLSTRCTLSTERANDIKTCLQEAVMNAIIHGNLLISPEDGSTVSFEDYLDRIDQCVEDELLGLKRVSIFAWFQPPHVVLCVSDQGKGFDASQRVIDNAKPYGRGLPLIHGMAHSVWQNAPNQLSMRFATDG